MVRPKTWPWPVVNWYFLVFKHKYFLQSDYMNNNNSVPELKFKLFFYKTSCIPWTTMCASIISGYGAREACSFETEQVTFGWSQLSWYYCTRKMQNRYHACCGAQKGLHRCCLSFWNPHLWGLPSDYIGRYFILPWFKNIQTSIKNII